MTTNLIGIDLTGLNTALGEIRTNVASILRDNEQNNKRDIAHLKATENSAIKTENKFGMLLKEITFCTTKIDDNGARVDRIDETLMNLASRLEAATELTNKQMETDTGQDYKIMMIKREVQETSTKLMNECQVLSKRIGDSNSVLDDQITKLSKPLLEITERVDASENTLTEILDRVELLENTALNPPEPIYQERTAESVVHVRDSIQSRGLPGQPSAGAANIYQKEADEDSLQFKIVQQIKEKIKQEVAISKSTLRKMVSESMTMMVQNELISRQASQAIVTEDQKESEVAVEASVEVPNTEFDHLPSLIEQAIEAHIKEVGDKVVYLDQIGPSKRRDGVYEIGSDIAQIQAHMEVQTFQYDRLNKAYSETNQTIAQMAFQIEDLTKKMKAMEKRVVATEEFQNFEIPEEGATLNTESLLAAIKALKGEMTLKMVSKDTIRELAKNVQTLQEQVQPFDLLATQTAFRDVLQDIRGQLEAFPREMQTIQLQLLRTENSTFEASREISDLWHRVLSQEKGAKTTHDTITNLFNDTDAAKKLATKDIIQLVNSLRDYTETNFAKNETLMKQNTGITETLTTLEQIKGHQQITHAKVLEHSKQIRMFGGQSSKIADELTNNKEWIAKIKKTINEKVDLEVYEIEKEQIFSEIASLDMRAHTSSAGGHAPSVVSKPPKARKSAPPSTAMNAQTKAAIETISVLEDQVNSMKSSIKNLNLGILRESVEQTGKMLDQKVNKTVLDSSLVKLNTDSSKIQQAMEKIRVESEAVMLNISKQMQRMMEGQETRAIEFKKMQNSMDQLEETIIALKRKNAGANARAGLMEKAASKADSNQPQFSIGGDQAEEMMGSVKQEFNQFKSEYQRKVENYDYKLAMLMPLVGGDKNKSSEKKLNAMEEMELKLTEKLARQDQAQVKIMEKLRNEFDALDQAFKEKIRRQGLVQQQIKHRASDDSGDDVRKNLKLRKKTYLAEQMTRELVLNGRLPQFGMQGDHIARYGKGFSQMLNIANPSIQYMESTSHRNNEASHEHVDTSLLNPPSHPDLLRVGKQGSLKAHNTFGTMDDVLNPSVAKSPLYGPNERVNGEKTYILRSKQKKNSVFVDVSQERSQEGGQDSTPSIWHGEKLPSIVRTIDDFVQVRVHNQTK